MFYSDLRFKLLFYQTHIKEVQYRFLYLAFSLCITFLFTSRYSFEFLFLLVQPFNGSKSFIFTHITEAFSTTLYVALVISFHLIFPAFFYQFWAFLVPALFTYERKKVSCCLLGILFLVIIECTFFFSFFLSAILQFFFNFEIQKDIFVIQLEARIHPYIDFLVTLYVAVFFLLQLPLALFLWIRFKPFALKTIILYRKYIYFVFLLLAAILSPPDLVYQGLVGICLLFFFEIGLWFSYIHIHLKKRLNF